MGRHSPRNGQTSALPMMRERTSCMRWAETWEMMVISSTRPIEVDELDVSSLARWNMGGIAA